MKHRIRALAVASALVVQLLIALAAVSAGPAEASTPGDDRQQTAPTSWWTYTGVSAAVLNSKLATNHARLTSLQVASHRRHVLPSMKARLRKRAPVRPPTVSARAPIGG